MPIVFNNKNGGVTVRTAIGISEEEAAAHAVKSGKATDEPAIVTQAELPNTPFRNALRKDGSYLRIDMPAAREIHRSRMRVVRAPKLAALDVEQLRGRNVEPQKQALRDVTDDPAIDAAKTPEELAAVWPDILK